MYELFVTSQLIHHHNSTFLSLKWIRLQKAMEKTRTLKSRLVVLERLVWKHKLENALLDENFEFFFFSLKNMEELKLLPLSIFPSLHKMIFF